MLMEILVFFIKREKFYRQRLGSMLLAAVNVLLHSSAAGALADTD